MGLQQLSTTHPDACSASTVRRMLDAPFAMGAATVNDVGDFQSEEMLNAIQEVR